LRFVVLCQLQLCHRLRRAAWAMLGHEMAEVIQAIMIAGLARHC